MKDPIIFLGHILECMNLLEEYVKNRTKEEVEKNIEKQDSINRRIEIIGEATKNIPVEIKEKYKAIPWKKMAGMRDILVHQYYGVSLEDTWDVIKKDIPKLKKQIQKIIKELEA